MVLMIVNNKIKTQMEEQMKREALIRRNKKKNQSEAEEINKLIQNMSNKLPQSDEDEFESQESTNEASSKLKGSR